ncbi:MAG: segregation/condensation protein A [Gammaproteobacteria bacterium]|nr:segregation/condensation protein A [Gammaproteobacteria bacterium]NCX48889.1 segregation/condensation protein A [Gammaproteobacteria bacterium]
MITHVQGELPLAVVEGSPLTQLPEDLYIPPDALEVILDAFEGPLDLLLYLIRRQNLDIIQINVAEITRQYMGYISLLEAMRFELAAEYLVMAAMLAEIKSRALLPRPVGADEDEEEDPRAELIRRLLEYEKVKMSAEILDELPRIERDFQVAEAQKPEIDERTAPPVVDLSELVLAFGELLARARLSSAHQIEWEPLSTRQRMSEVLMKLRDRAELTLSDLFSADEGKAGVVVSFLAILELVREGLCALIQAAPGSQIYIRRASQDV